MLAIGQLSAQTNPAEQSTVTTIAGTTNSSAQQELDELMAEDDAAMDEVDGWIRTNNIQAANGSGEARVDLNQQINARLDVVRQKYEDFLKRYPNYAPGHLAYGSFLDDIGKEDLASVEFVTASQLDPKNPATWNDLANYYGEDGPITNAFIDYQKAIALDPTEPVYYENLATTVYVFRRDAMQYYQITEPQVFDKSLALYRKAIQLDPNDFELASDYAESYYGIKPLRTNDALIAWTNALNSAQTEVEREGVYIHFARIKIAAGRYEEARAQLAAVTNSMYDVLKNRLERNIVAKENPPTNAVQTNLPGTNSPAQTAVTNIQMEISTNNEATNGIPALTNAPALSSNMISVMTNVSPAQTPLQSTNPPVNPTNLLNNLEVTPPAPRPEDQQ